MYAFVDRHPGTLGNSGRFLLWAMRGWARAVAKRTCPPAVLHRAFHGVGAAAALPDFHIAMALCHRDASRKLRMAQIACCRIHEDEAVLLSLWHAVARQDSALVTGTLEHLVDEGAVRPIGRAMAACVTQLVLAGFDLTETHAAKIEE